MKFHCTLVCSPGSRRQGPPLELTVEAPEKSSGADLGAHLARQFKTGQIMVDGRDIATLHVGVPPLCNGAVLVDGQEASGKVRRRPPGEEPRLALAVHSGAGAGTLMPLRRGSYIIGRSCRGILIADPELSREHARIDVGDTDIMIVDLDSANGVHVDGERVRHALVSTASSIRCGNSTMSLMFMNQPENALSDAGTSTQEALIVPGVADNNNRGMLILAAAVPLAIGIGLAVVTGMWMFLAFAGASAVSVLIPLATGQRQRRELTEAVAAAVDRDRNRRQRSGPSLALLVLAATHTSPRKTGPTGSGVWLRLGQAAMPANVRVEPAGRSVAIPSAGVVPVTLDPAVRLTTFQGPGTVSDGLVRSLLMQLGGYPSAYGTRIHVHGEPNRLPLAARYLPDVTLTASAADALRILGSGSGPVHTRGVFLLLGTPGDGAGDDALRDAALAHGWQVLHFPPAEGPASSRDIELTERQAILRRGQDDISFVPDLAQEEAFDAFFRRSAGSSAVAGRQEPAVPENCTLQDVLPLSAEETAVRWKYGAEQPALRIPLGLGATGPRYLDLQADGPHLLVAGTTGSGKSELLRTLTLALALSYPPDRVNFLFVDFKGGSGLGPLTDLVHCVGMVTDLSGHELERTLVSLRAEVRQREQILATVEAPDLTSYRNSQAGLSTPLPHLVIVIDEFRMLVDEAPEALRELMRIASIGRSLGIHLVMATQRPQGALTADIRANVTSSIALRVQSDMESTDIINTKAAATIGVNVPGRAFLARGMEAPQEFQTASLSPLPSRPAPTTTKVALAIHALGSRTTGSSLPVGVAGQTPAQAAAPLVRLVQELWRERDGTVQRSPVAPPLPPVLPAPLDLPAPYRNPRPEPGAGSDQAWCLELGLMDLPDKQKVQPLTWIPAQDSHLGLIGSPVSGVAETLEFAATGIIGRSSDTHAYILDADGTLRHLAGHARVGAHVGMHDLRRGARVLERLKQEVAERLARGRGQESGPLLVLVISGWGSWLSAFRSGPLAWAEDLVQDVARDGRRAGLVVLITGDRELVSSRLFASLPNRIYFPTGSNMDSRIAWPRMPVTAEVKSRGVAFGSLAGGGPAVSQLYSLALPRPQIHEPPSVPDPQATRPFRVEPLPALIPAAKVNPAAGGGYLSGGSHVKVPPGANPTAPGQVVIGVGGDELAPLSCRLPRAGVLTVLGGPSTGKTNFLRAVPLMNPASSAWLTPEEGADPAEFWQQALSRARAADLPADAVVLVDDADRLADGALRHLSDLHDLGHSVILTAGYSPLLLQRLPLVMTSRSAGTGLLLSPRSLSDGDIFGVRFELDSHSPPGRGILICGGSTARVQTGLAPSRAQ